MNIREMFVKSLHQQNPKLFAELQRSGQLEEAIMEAGRVARERLSELLASYPKHENGEAKDKMAQMLAEETVLGQILDFPVPLARQRPEPGSDLPTRASKARIS